MNARKTYQYYYVYNTNVYILLTPDEFNKKRRHVSVDTLRNTFFSLDPTQSR